MKLNWEKGMLFLTEKGPFNSPHNVTLNTYKDDKSFIYVQILYKWHYTTNALNKIWERGYMDSQLIYDGTCIFSL